MDEGFSDDDFYYNIAASFMLNEDKGGVKGKCTLSYHSIFLLVALMPLIVAALSLFYLYFHLLFCISTKSRSVCMVKRHARKKERKKKKTSSFV